MTPSAGTIAVLTASSTTGTACINTLLSTPSGPPVLALFRRAERSLPLQEAHGSNKRLTIRHPVDANDVEEMTRQFSGCATAFLITPFDATRHDMSRDSELACNMIRAAVDGGVTHVIFAASWTVSAKDAVPLLASRFLAAEAELAAACTRMTSSGHTVTWSVLRGGYFQSNYGFLAAQLQKGNTVSFCNFCVPCNDVDDIGRTAAAIALTGGRGHEGRVYDISGPACVSLEEIVAMLSRILEREIEFVDRPVEEATKALPPYLQELFRYLSRVGEQAVPLSEDVLRVTGKPAVGVENWLRQNKHVFKLKSALS